MPRPLWLTITLSASPGNAEDFSLWHCSLRHCSCHWMAQTESHPRWTPPDRETMINWNKACTVQCRHETIMKLQLAPNNKINTITSVWGRVFFTKTTRIELATSSTFAQFDSITRKRNHTTRPCSLRSRGSFLHESILCKRGLQCLSASRL